MSSVGSIADEKAQSVYIPGMRCRHLGPAQKIPGSATMRVATCLLTNGHTERRPGDAVGYHGHHRGHDVHGNTIFWDDNGDIWP